MPVSPNETGVVGTPVGDGMTDPGDVCPLNYTMWYPVGGNGSDPGPFVVSLRSGHFSDGAESSLESALLVDFANRGYYAVHVDNRLMVGGDTGGAGIPQQTTDGRFPQQTNDVAQIIRWVRAQSRCIGFVGGAGGSGSGYIVGYNMLTGTEGDDRFDAVIIMSGPMDLGDRDADMFDNNARALHIMCDYGRADPDDDTQPTHDLLVSESPLGNIPTDSRWIYHYNGGLEDMPASQFHHFADAMEAQNLITPGVTDHYVQDFEPNSRNHSFGSWHGVPRVADRAIPFMEDAFAFWQTTQGGGGGGGEPPPPPTPTREKITARITGMDPSTFMVLNVAAREKATGLTGAFTPFEFVSDRDSGASGQKEAPEGNWVQVPAPGGDPGDLTTRPWLDFAYVNGAHLPTQLNLVYADRNQIDWTVVNNFLALMDNHGKQGSISIACGIFTPIWVYQRGVRSFTLTSGATMPLPWDPNWINLLKGVIRDFANNFDANPALGYVFYSGFMQNIDCLLAAQIDYNALNQVAINDGFLNLGDAFSFAAQTLTQYWSKACKNTRCLLALGYPVPQLQSGLTVMGDLITFLQSTVGNRFCVFADTLTGATHDDGAIDGLMNQYSGHFQGGHQFAFPSSDPLCDPTQPPETYDAETGLVNASTAGADLHDAFQEFKEEDILKTTDNYPTHFADFQTALLANSHN